MTGIAFNAGESMGEKLALRNFAKKILILNLRAGKISQLLENLFLLLK